MTDWEALTAELYLGPPATEELLKQVLAGMRVRPPADYVAFMRRTNGAEGPVGAHGYLQLWRLEELIELNREYQVQEFAPGLFLFGSDGGGEAYAFARPAEHDRDCGPVQIVRVPFVPLDIAEARLVGTSFEAFLRHLAQQPVRSVLVVDAANVIGSVPDGWWHDRAGAAGRLHAALTRRQPPYDQPRSGGAGAVRRPARHRRRRHLRARHRRGR